MAFRVKLSPCLEYPQNTFPPHLLPLIRQHGDDQVFRVSPEAVVLKHPLSNGHVFLHQVLGQLQQEEVVPCPFLNVREALKFEPARKVQIEHSFGESDESL